MSIPKRQLHKSYRDTRTSLEKRVGSLETNVAALNALVSELRAQLQPRPPGSQLAPSEPPYPILPITCSADKFS